MDEPPVAAVLYGSDNKVVGIVYGDDSPIAARTESNYYDGFCILSYYPPSPCGWREKLKRRLVPPTMKVAAVQTGEDGELDEVWCATAAQELTRQLGFGVVQEVNASYSYGEPWVVVMEFSSKDYGPRVEKRIQNTIDWILENYDAEVMGGPDDEF